MNRPFIRQIIKDEEMKHRESFRRFSEKERKYRQRNDIASGVMIGMIIGLTIGLAIGSTL